jgi:hypothetical protein
MIFFNLQLLKFYQNRSGVLGLIIILLSDGGGIPQKQIPLPLFKLMFENKIIINVYRI